MLMLTNSCANNSVQSSACDYFQYVLITPQDKLTPTTERSILTNDEVLKEDCKKAMPPTKQEPSWLERHLGIAGNSVFELGSNPNSYILVQAKEQI